MLAPAQTVELRRPDFLVAPPASEDELRDHFDLGFLEVEPHIGVVLHDVMTLGQSIVILPEGTFLDAELGITGPRAFSHPVHSYWLKHVEGRTFEVSHAERIAITVEEPAIFLGVPGLASYHHWLVDALAKLALISEDDLATMSIAVPDTVPEGFIGLLGALGGNPERVIRVPQAAAVRYRHLVLFPYVASTSTVYRPALEEMRRRVLSHTTPWVDGPDKVLITRRDAPLSDRLLVNEPEVIDLFSARGYMPIAPGTLAFNGQVASMLAASRIVAVHGAGAANVLFSDTGSSVLHLQPEDSRFRAQGLISAVRQQRHGYFFGDCFSDRQRGQHVEWVVDVEALSRLLDEAEF